MQKNQLTALLYGWIVVLGIILLSSVVLALVLQFTAFDEPGLKWTTLIIGILALFLGGITAGAKEIKGWLIGTTIGLGFTLLIFLVQYLGYQQGFSLEQSIHHLGFLAAALVGGIIGVNLIGGQVE